MSDASAPPAAQPWALLLEYDGTGFAGWQRQAGPITVQQVLEEAAARLNGGQPVVAAVAGRTDTGVHAEAQVAQIALPRPFGADKLRDALNHHLQPHKVVVLRAAPAPPGWHPRFSAIGRAYRYRILNRPVASPLLAGRVWHVRPTLDVPAMAAAAAHLCGHHDFTTFRASACQASNSWRTLDRLAVRQDGPMIEIVAEARSFLHHQVRNMVGTLAWVGRGRWHPDQVATVLAARDRRAGGPTAPPDGLSLTGVRYPGTVFDA